MYADDPPAALPVCKCRNCVSGGAYEDETGIIPSGCHYRYHKHCQGCEYYGPIRNAEQLCDPCLRAHRRDVLPLLDIDQKGTRS
ncbi:hypothetical protein [Nocardia heshunensis]